VSEIQNEQTFERGKPINVVRRFFRVDPITLVETLTDPGTVTFTIRDPNNVETSYVYTVDANLIRISVGLYVCELDPLLPVGDYRYVWVGTDPVPIAADGSFTITESGVLPPDSPDIAVYGPCSPWISGDEVSVFDQTLGIGSDTFLLDDVAVIASQLAYEASGRQFPGVCTATVRPCRTGCGCWGDISSGFNWWWGTLPSGIWPGGWGWRNEGGDACGCGYESYVRLAGYPVRKILSVTVDGIDVPELDSSGDRNWRLDQRRNLIRMADLSTTPPADRFWPACQNMNLPATEPGTFQIEYLWGADPPALAKMAAAELAVELWKASPSNAGVCRLPSRVVTVVRQGITMTKIVSTADLLRSGMTGLQVWDAFISMTNPQGARQRSAVFSPDLQSFAREIHE
jgi:hypothetical protein